jgi:hypothetical protein
VASGNWPQFEARIGCSCKVKGICALWSGVCERSPLQRAVKHGGMSIAIANGSYWRVMKVASCIAHATCGEFSFRLVYVEVTRLNVKTAAIARLDNMRSS